jgi:acetamidase/formamidase
VPSNSGAPPNTDQIQTTTPVNRLRVDHYTKLAGNAGEMSALPEFAAQHSILSLARADIPGVAAHMRPLLGNIGTMPSRDLPDSHNCADFGQYLINAPHRFGMTREELHAAKTDGHMDTNSIREGCVLICPMNVLDRMGIGHLVREKYELT